MPVIESKRDLAVELAFSLYDTPYGWGGNTASMDGFLDCSGLIRQILDDLGMIPDGADYASWQFAQMYPETRDLKPGVLVFWLRGSRIGHVEMVIGRDGNDWWVMGASGGGRHTDTLEEAREADARVKPRPIPPNWVKAVDPFAVEDV